MPHLKIGYAEARLGRQIEVHKVSDIGCPGGKGHQQPQYVVRHDIGSNSRIPKVSKDKLTAQGSILLTS